MFSLCHQIPERSFLWLWDPPWLCARCTGFYLALLVAVMFFLFLPMRARTWSRGVIVAGLVSMAAILLEKFVGLDLGNWGRFSTALPLGFAVGLGLAMPFLSRSFEEESK